MGSVKDLKVLENPTKDQEGIGRFTFSDRYSVFDWGEMPDLIPHKGEAIAILGAYFFEKFEKMGFKTHYIGLVEDGEAKKLSELKKPSNEMQIKLLRVLEPLLKDGNYDYSQYRDLKGNCLIPLELIYRNYIPEGSSVFGRLQRGEIELNDLGLDEIPAPNEKLETPILDVSTKLEITDRYLKWDEAQAISGLSSKEIKDLKNLLAVVNEALTAEFSKIDMINEDGKIEVGYNSPRDLILVDVIGTLDECRFTFKGLPVSKEIARIHYRGSGWYEATEQAKAKNRAEWKNICAVNPDPLPTKLKSLISQIYCACTNEITGQEWFEGLRPLKEIITEIGRELNGK
ncbi:MAG: phosphoribosylaminoimidazolesuccinocarboxamide synthase [Methanobacteriaceae archaeon]|nr:phosphoribosylaminoimidazolesuccinocarboxamide synthase [Methanobacteriaceae archaeon]